MDLSLNARSRGLILLATLILATVGVVYLSHTLVPFFIAFALVYLLNPMVTYLSKLKLGKRELGRLGGIVVLYCLFGLAIWFMGLFVLPQLYKEFIRLAQVLPKEILNFEQHVLPELVIQWQSYLDTYNVPLDLKKSIQDGVTAVTDGIQGGVGELAKRARDLVAGVFSAILMLVLVFMLTGFLLYDLPRLSAWLHKLVPEEYRGTVEALVRDIDRGLSGAVRGQIGVCIVNGVLTTVGLLLLHVKFAITLGVVAGIFSLIPVFGTLVSTIPAVLVGLTHSPLTAFLVLLWILAIHLLEANFLNPKIIGHNAELHPALVVLALLLGEHYGGAVGLLIAVPLATVVRALMTYTLGRVLIPKTPSEPPPAPMLVQEEAHFEGVAQAHPPSPMAGPEPAQ